MTPGERLDIIKTLKPILLEMSNADAFLHVSDRYQRLRVAQNSNDQVRNAYNIPAFLGDLADEYDDLPRPGPMEDKPF